MAGRISKQGWIIILLVVLLALALAYILVLQFRGWQFSVASAAYQQGYTDAALGVISNAQRCEPFQVYVGNVSVDLIAVKCLQLTQPAPQPQIPPAVLENQQPPENSSDNSGTNAPN
ncbi:hypothetical protein D6817_02650 [Candidatus Pacearchaeota archaeon]|nr:MAG: hypothetical protein D6817_02650 [Candidatus Pacearchaeota archaeon]